MNCLFLICFLSVISSQSISNQFLSNTKQRFQHTNPRLFNQFSKLMTYNEAKLTLDQEQKYSHSNLDKLLSEIESHTNTMSNIGFYILKNRLLEEDWRISKLNLSPRSNELRDYLKRVTTQKNIIINGSKFYDQFPAIPILNENEVLKSLCGEKSSNPKNCIAEIGHVAQ